MMWTDALQSMVMFIGCITILIFVLGTVGGPLNVLDVIEKTNRSIFDDFD